MFFIFFIQNQNKIFAQNAHIDLLRKINVHRNTNLDCSMQFISNTEYVVGMGVPISFFTMSLIKKDTVLFHNAINISVALLFNTANTYLLKRVINRKRPIVCYPYLSAFEDERHYSMPSGHTSNAFCTATSLSLHCKKWYVVIPSFTWATAVGYSRMHLGVHYPSDVLAGALLGVASGWVTYKANKFIRNIYGKKVESRKI